MTTHADRSDNTHNWLDAASPFFNLFARSDGLWWPHRSLTKALLGGQRNGLAYLEANRRLLDEMRNIVRKEQDLALELSQMAFEGGAEMSDALQVNAVFEHAATGLRALCEAWVDAQLRSLDTMRSLTPGGRKSQVPVRPETPAAPDPLVEEDGKPRAFQRAAAKANAAQRAAAEAMRLAPEAH